MTDAERIRNELIRWLLQKGLDTEEGGYGHVTAEDLADDLLDRYEMNQKEEE